MRNYLSVAKMASLVYERENCLRDTKIFVEAENHSYWSVNFVSIIANVRIFFGHKRHNIT